MFDHFLRRGDAFTIELGEIRFEIERIPIDDGIDEQVQPGRPIELALEGPVAEFSEAIEEQRAGQGALGFALVEADGSASAHF